MGAMIDDETLDRQLREAVAYIDDDGFTARVMASVPLARREPRWLRWMILIGLAALGSGVAYLVSGGGRFVRALGAKAHGNLACRQIDNGGWNEKRRDFARPAINQR